ncbi:hypothetical protein [Streptomyces sp. NRRL F-5123]|uniref:hypothetical protein n=1 Tax=Streptomyces sp. NRRL F-5123 TaxID=1463856 RepID=UPI0004E25D36|nr:hypothetical protein [Streptomyces sp. NRRL F-5123]
MSERTEPERTEPGAEPERAERELRALLERAVPQPPAPAQRLERVRERVRRRRRRRTAAVTGGAVLAVAAGLVAVPGLVRPDGGGRAAPAVVGSASPRTGAAAPTTPPSGYRPDGMGGLVLRLPAGKGWQKFADPATTSLFLGTQRMVLPAGGCAHALDGFCTPLALALKKDGALVMFRRQPSKMSLGKAAAYELPLAEAAPYQACRTVGGTRQLTRTAVAPDGTVVWAVACLATPTPARFQEAWDLLSSAAFG